ncbi:hypothetical protein GCM10023205_31200 [Yinghuangia aomiensis]|uniref:Uncharacterized protein n=1 Tax=Yinghuangia aomiensis TaxID=676205 RepID=A0ABP9H9I4_9ACTN
MRSAQVTLLKATAATVAATSVLALAATPVHASPARVDTAMARYSVPLYAERSLSSGVVGNIVIGVEYQVTLGWERGEAFPDGYCGTSGTVNDHWRRVILVEGERAGWTSTTCIY